MNASRESGSTRRYFHVDRVTGGGGSSPGNVRKFRSRAEARRSGIPPRPECRRAERANEARPSAHRGIGASHPKNFNLGIFRINERSGQTPPAHRSRASRPPSSPSSGRIAIYPSHQRSLSRQNVIPRLSSKKRRQIFNKSMTARLAHSCGFIRSPCFTHEGFESRSAMPA